MPVGRSAPSVSVVIPTWREKGVVGGAVRSATEEGADEVIVSDGGSDDGTADEAREAGARVVLGAKGRGPQLNAGASAARGDVLLFLHADTRLPRGGVARVRRLLADPAVVGGRFDVALDHDGLSFRLVEWGLNWRSHATGLFTGDH